MRTALIAASLSLAVCFVSPSYAAPDQQIQGAAPAKKRMVAQPAKPTYEQCFDMSITRGFNHGRREWRESIQDCMDGKIPLQ
jgi:hypothetical protein